jgi:hypothetical protein
MTRCASIERAAWMAARDVLVATSLELEAAQIGRLLAIVGRHQLPGSQAGGIPNHERMNKLPKQHT